jgi:hypothetical protein
MRRDADPFVPLGHETLADDEFRRLQRRAAAAAQPVPPHIAPAVGRLRGFDLLDQPLVGDLAALPGEVVPGRSTVALQRAQVGREVLVLFDGGDPRAPIVIGVLEPRPLQDDALLPPPRSAVLVDGERHLIEAEREIVLRCGEASITLTRAGKVLIKGSYVLSRSTGYNKIKGAAVDIN